MNNVLAFVLVVVAAGAIWYFAFKSPAPAAIETPAPAAVEEVAPAAEAPAAPTAPVTP